MPTNGRADGLRGPNVRESCQKPRAKPTTRRFAGLENSAARQLAGGNLVGRPRQEQSGRVSRTSSGPVVAQVIPNFKACRSGRVYSAGLPTTISPSMANLRLIACLTRALPIQQDGALHHTDVTVLLRQGENVIGVGTRLWPLRCATRAWTGAGNKRSGARHLAYDSICTSHTATVLNSGEFRRLLEGQHRRPVRYDSYFSVRLTDARREIAGGTSRALTVRPGRRRVR